MREQIQIILTDEAKNITDVLASKDVVVDFKPFRGTSRSAGSDLRLCSYEAVHIHPYETVKVNTGLKIFLGSINESDEAPPEDVALVGLLFPRSSNKGLQLENTIGVLDDDYQDEIFLKLYNKTEEVITIAPGERIAQLIILPALLFDFVETDAFTTKTDRKGGDGHTGKF